MSEDIKDKQQVETNLPAVQRPKRKKRLLKKQVNKMLFPDGDQPQRVAMMPKIFVQTTIPHAEIEEDTYVRKNGNIELTIRATKPGVGLPYGIIPRIFLVWLVAEVKKSGSRYINVGESTHELLYLLDMYTDVRYYRSLHEQMLRLMRMSITLDVDDGKTVSFAHMSIFEEGKYDKGEEWKPELIISTQFKKLIDESTIPVDFDAVRALGGSLSIDIYIWLTYRASTLREPVMIKWSDLAAQFGSNYTRLRAFKEKFIESLNKVKAIWINCNASPTSEGLLVKPARPHIKKTVSNRTKKLLKNAKKE